MIIMGMCFTPHGWFAKTGSMLLLMPSFLCDNEGVLTPCKRDDICLEGEINPLVNF